MDKFDALIDAIVNPLPSGEANVLLEDIPDLDATAICSPDIPLMIVE